MAEAEAVSEIRCLCSHVMERTANWPWPDSLDALTAAPAHHQLLEEDDGARVIMTHIPPGDLVPLHTHRWRAVGYVLSMSHFIRRDQDGKVLFDSRAAGELPKAPHTQWFDPFPPHTVENVGDTELRVYVVEFKR